MEAVIGLNTHGRLPAHQKERQIPQWLMPFLYNWKKILLFSIIACLLVGGIAFCATWQEDLANGDMGFAQKFVLKMFDSVFGVNDLDDSKALLQVTRNGYVLRVGSYTINIMNVLTTENRIFVNIGTCWLLVCWGASFYDMLMQNNNQMIVEQMIRKFIYLVIGLALVQNAMDIVFTLTNFGTEVLNGIAGAAAANTSNIDDVKQVIYEDMTSATGLLAFLVDFVTCVTYILEMFIPWLVSLVCSLLVSVVCWSRFVEICILATVSPVMFADIGDDRGGLMHTSAMKAIKNILALALSGALIFVSLYISGNIAASITAGSTITAGAYLDACYTQVILAIVRVGLCSKASSLSKQLVGLA